MAGEKLCPACKTGLEKQYKNPYYVRLSGVTPVPIASLILNFNSTVDLAPEIRRATRSYEVEAYLHKLTTQVFAPFSYCLETPFVNILPPFTRHPEACSHFMIPDYPHKYSLTLRQPDPILGEEFSSNTLILAVWGNYMHDDDIRDGDDNGVISNELATIAHLTFHGNPNPAFPPHF